MPPVEEGAVLKEKAHSGGSAAKNPLAVQKMWVHSVSQEDPLEWEMEPTPVFLPGNPWFLESGRSPGVGNGNPLQYSCQETHGSLSQEGPLEWEMEPTPVFLPGKPMDRGARWASIHLGWKSWT